MMASVSRNISDTISGIAFSVLGAVLGGVVLSAVPWILNGEYTIGWLVCGVLVGFALSLVQVREPAEKRLMSAFGRPHPVQPYRRTLQSDMIWGSASVLLIVSTLIQLTVGWNSVSPMMILMILFVSIISGSIIAAGSWLVIGLAGSR